MVQAASEDLVAAGPARLDGEVVAAELAEVVCGPP